MIDQTSQFFAILTNVGAAKQANADALGVPWRITEMGVGDANDTDPVPSAAQTSLINEWRRRPLNQLFIDPVNPAVIVAEQVIPADEGGYWIREIGLYDADGDLVAVANCPPSFKPIMSQGSGRTQVVRMNFIVSSTGNITLKIDPSVVLATREYVERRILEELYKLDNKQSVRAATTVNIALTGLQTIDGVSLLAGDRVLVKNQTASKDNGIYIVGVAAWQRAPDADSSAEVTSALILSVEQGATLADTRWQLVTDGAIVLGTTSLAFQNITQGFATINSPVFQGNPTAPTPAVTDNDTSVATTAFVRNVLARYGLAGYGYVWNGNIDQITETGVYTFSDGSSGTRPKNPATGADIPRGVLFHMERDITLSALQIWESVNAGVALTFKRSRLSNGVWTAWAQLWDGLNTPKQADPLDVSPGAMLTVGSFGWGAAAVSYTGDIDAIAVSGLYMISAATTGTKPEYPSQQGVGVIPNGTILHMERGSSKMATQLWDSLVNSINPVTCIRTKNANGVWSQWQIIVLDGHLPFRGTLAYKAAGVFTWTVPVGVKKAWVTVIGGGGGGGRSGVSGIGSGGGGGGGVSQRLVDLSTVSSVTVTVGAGGAGASVEGAAGETGGTSSFGAFLSATGGIGGLGSSSAGLASGPGGGGGGTGGDFNTSLGVGHVSYGAVGGSGGGPGGRCTQGPYPGNGGMGPGGGGSGALFGYNGGPGAAGNVIIQW
ncbi:MULTISPECIES: phage tail protein [unclassified Pseudomonas]|uniref:phage tail-collar fiber domain-containing protein n=1 Tax=unclassified Pseudomonas TaxID=196821 RepID=UPI00088597FB|nr:MULTISPECIES: phage tail protein [unclassified Pseudomonas]SDB18379.1 Phage-related tail fibre protein [Pseudomonas sp. NFACC17-2]